MAQFQVVLASGETIRLEAEATDNVPEFVRELKESGYVAGRLDNGESVALIDPHVAIVQMI